MDLIIYDYQIENMKLGNMQIKNEYILYHFDEKNIDILTTNINLIVYDYQIKNMELGNLQIKDKYILYHPDKKNIDILTKNEKINLIVYDYQIENMESGNLQIKDEYILYYPDEKNIDILIKNENVYILDFKHYWFYTKEKESDEIEKQLLKNDPNVNYTCHFKVRKCEKLKTQFSNKRIFTEPKEYLIIDDLFIDTKRHTHIGKNIKEISFIRQDLIDASWLFAECWYAENSNFFPELKTEIIEDMSYMYYNCARLKVLDLSEYNTERVKDMNHMFDTCGYLEKLSLSNFNMDNVKNTDCMLMNCINLKELRLDNCSKDTIQKIIKSKCFPICNEIRKIEYDYDEDIYDLIIQEHTEEDLLEELKPIDNDLRINEYYIRYYPENKNIDFIDAFKSKHIYCRKENTNELNPPKGWRFKYIDRENDK